MISGFRPLREVIIQRDRYGSRHLHLTKLEKSGEYQEGVPVLGRPSRSCFLWPSLLRQSQTGKKQSLASGQKRASVERSPSASWLPSETSIRSDVMTGVGGYPSTAFLIRTAAFVAVQDMPTPATIQSNRTAIDVM